MKVKTEKEKEAFEPIKLTVTIETEHELTKFYSLSQSIEFFSEIERHLKLYI